jgi:hypothetical protein
LNNLANGLSLIGCNVILAQDLDEDIITDFQPSQIILSDTPRQVEIINKFGHLLRRQNCQIGISAVTPLDQSQVKLENQLKKYADLGVNFLWGFKNDEFYRHDTYTLQLESKSGLPVISIPFGADVTAYYPIIKNRTNRSLDFIFLASRNLDKWSVIKPILLKLGKSGLSGVINGPGWNKERYTIQKSDHMRFFSSARNGLNAHIPMSRDKHTELNERFYNLMLSGLPQVVDDIPLLDSHGFRDKVAVYSDAHDLLRHLQPGTKMNMAKVDRSLAAYNSIMDGHTNLHRANNLCTQLLKLDRY